MKVKGSLQISGTTEGITFTDGSTTFARQPKLSFGASDFYLGADAQGYVKVNLKHPGLRVSGNQDYDSAMRLSFAEGSFYLDGGSTGQPVVNLRFEPQDTLQLYSEAPSIGNLFIDTCAPYSYTLDRASVQLQSGTASIGFYIVDEGLNNNGSSITSLDPISATSTRQVIASGATVLRGQQVKVSLWATSSAKQLRISVEATRI